MKIYMSRLLCSLLALAILPWVMGCDDEDTTQDKLDQDIEDFSKDLVDEVEEVSDIDGLDDSPDEFAEEKDVEIVDLNETEEVLCLGEAPVAQLSEDTLPRGSEIGELELVFSLPVQGLTEGALSVEGGR